LIYRDGHCLPNRSGTEARVLEVGTRAAEDAGFHPDIDLVAPAGGKPAVYTHRGRPYEHLRGRGPDG
jgi:uncharacterized cupin superfamily protein